MEAERKRQEELDDDDDDNNEEMVDNNKKKSAAYIKWEKEFDGKTKVDLRERISRMRMH